MATQTIENFNTLDLETLASVEGGRVNWERWGMVLQKDSLQLQVERLSSLDRMQLELVQ